MQAKGKTDFACPRHPHPIHKDGKELAAEITGLCSYIYAATYRLLVLIREFDEQGYWEWPGLCSCAHWLNFKCGIGMNAAREKVRVAHALAKLPKISEAFRRGTVVIQARLPAEQGALVMKALELAMERRETDMRSVLRAHEKASGKTARRPLEPFDASRADALVEIAESYLNNGATSASAADRYQVVVHVSAETLKRGSRCFRGNVDTHQRRPVAHRGRARGFRGNVTPHRLRGIVGCRGIARFRPGRPRIERMDRRATAGSRDR
jgi:hypothetical protein